MVKVSVSKIGHFFFSSIFSLPEIFEKMMSFFLGTKSAILASFDEFSQKWCLKKGKILFDAFISINKRKYVSIFYKKVQKG